MIFDLELGEREQRRLEHVDRRGMSHQHRVHALEGSAFEQERLAVAELFGRRAEHGQPHAEVVDVLA